MNIKKYIDDKLVKITNITQPRDISINDNIVELDLFDGRLITFEFDNYKNACKGLKLIEEKLEKEEWEEEFEDTMEFICDELACEHGINFTHRDIDKVLEKFLDVKYIDQRVKVKCKDGMIQIERIK